MKTDRRKFLQNAAQITAGLSLSSLPVLGSVNYQHKFSANDTVRVGLIGCKNMGWSNLSSMLTHAGVECVALCDIDSNVLNERSAELKNRTGKKAKLYSDYRKLLDDKDVDAVIIGTPDHWHCLQTIHACEAGKDVYVEKPIANTIEESNLMVAAVNRYNRVVQVGQWQRSDPHWISALDYLNKDKLGKIRAVKTWAFTNYGRSFPVKPDEPIPTGVDYEMWLGPAPNRPFNPNRFHGSWRYFWDYGGGLMTDWGVHMIDMALAGMKVSSPVSVSATGGNYGFPDSAAETPDTLHTAYDFGDFSMVWEQSMGTGNGPYNYGSGMPGVAFIGNLGTLVINRDKWEVLPEEESGKFLVEPLPVQNRQRSGIDPHTLNFLECIKSREQTNCTIEMGRNSALNAQMGNISYKLGNKVFWDKDKGLFVNNVQANELAQANYRGPWTLPGV